MEDNVQKLANAGQPEDSQIIHAAPGEMVVPPVISEQTQQMINQDLQSVGLNPAEYMVGQGLINSATGLQEFGFLSKLFKKVKKVVKKVAPVAAFIPGVGTALGGVLGGVAGKVGSAVGLKGTVAKKVLGGLAKTGIPGISSIAGGAAGGFGSLKGLGSLRGLMKGSPFTGMFSQQPMMSQQITQEEFDAMTPLEQQLYLSQQQMPSQETGPLGLPFGPQLRKRFLGEGSQPIFGQQIGSQQGGGLGLGGVGNLALLFGLATKKAADKTKGGLTDVRLSTRPDLMPQQTFQGFDLGIRPGMSYGGALGYRPGFAMGNNVDVDAFMEQDMRMGGPSVGPGTETSDDIPAMLSDGEFVMTAAANKGLGGFKIEKNKDSLTIFPTGKPDREQGFKNNDKLMKFFEDYQEMMS